MIESINSITSRAVTPRTKMIIVNTPHNPVGKVFTKKELEFIAALAQEFNLIVMSDEVVGVTMQRNYVYFTWLVAV
jgi:aspartate/methionine/tyrosine aminotransferase